MTGPTMTTVLAPRAIARWVHPAAWWAWAIAAALCASFTTNPLLLASIIVSCGVVVTARRPLAPWGRSFRFFLIIGLVIVLFRMLAQVLLVGSWVSVNTAPLFVLPQLQLPALLGGLTIGGPVVLDALLAGFYDGLRLATIIIALGAAQSLASPSRLLKAAPTAIYDLGVSITIAITFLPMLVSDIQRVRTFRRLRGRPVRGVRAWRAIALPVLHGALERSVALAASMDSRGYGSHDRSPRQSRQAAALLAVGFLLVTMGMFAILSATLSAPIAVLLLLAGGITLFAAMRALRTPRTRYRPDHWGMVEWGVTATGAVALAGMAILAISSPTVAHPPTSPASWPQLSAWALTLVALALPALFTPPCPDRTPIDADYQ